MHTYIVTAKIGTNKHTTAKYVQIGTNKHTTRTTEIGKKNN